MKRSDRVHSDPQRGRTASAAPHVPKPTEHAENARERRPNTRDRLLAQLRGGTGIESGPLSAEKRKERESGWNSRDRLVQKLQAKSNPNASTVGGGGGGGGGGGMRAKASAARAEGSAKAQESVRAQDGQQNEAPVQETAEKGFATGGARLPHLDRIQRAFGPGHDLSGVRAHVGGPAADASKHIGAEAYAMGDQVAFQRSPNLHTAAHEAAHVVQQRAGVHLYGGVGEAGDRYERNADAVADRVVRGQSAHDLLPGGSAGHGAGAGSGSRVGGSGARAGRGAGAQRMAVQRKEGEKEGQKEEPGKRGGGAAARRQLETIAANRMGFSVPGAKAEGEGEEKKEATGPLSAIPGVERKRKVYEKSFPWHAVPPGGWVEARLAISGELKSVIKPKGSSRQISIGDGEHGHSIEVEQEIENDIVQTAVKFEGDPKEGAKLALEVGGERFSVEASLNFNWEKPVAIAAKGPKVHRTRSIGDVDIEVEFEPAWELHLRPTEKLLLYLGEKAAEAAGSSAAPYLLAGGVTLAYFAWAFEAMVAVGEAGYQGKEKALAFMFARKYAEALADISEPHPSKVNLGYVLGKSWEAEYAQAREMYHRPGTGPQAQEAIARLETAAYAKAVGFMKYMTEPERQQWAAQIRSSLAESRDARYIVFLGKMLASGDDPEFMRILMYADKSGQISFR